MQNIFLVAAVIGLAAGRLGLADDTNPMPGKSLVAEITAASPLRSIAAHEVERAANLLPPLMSQQRLGALHQGWQPRAWSGKESVRWSDQSPGRNDKPCLAIGSQKGGDAAWTATVTVRPDTYYRLSGWIKTEDVRSATGALLNIQNMQQVRTDAVTGNSDWTRVSTIFRSTSTTTLEINCLFGGWGQSTGQAWYDGVTLEQIAPPPAEATVTINTDAQTVPYSRMIFGGFLEHFDRQVYGGVFEPGSPLSDARGFRKDVLAALKELRVPVVRWPGGCFVSGYHWEPGVGKPRKPVDDMAWGVVEPNTFGTDEYVELCRLLGWEPYICNNAGNGTIEEMRNWVEYCNGTSGKYAQLRRANGYPEPRSVPIWSIGNENWGAHEIGQKPIDQWAPLVLEAAKAMKSVDPQLKLTAAALPTREWTLPLLKMAGPYLDYISIHNYWIPLWTRNDMPDYLTCIMHSEGPEESIVGCLGVLDESGYRGKIKIAYDEWNLRAWHHEGFPRKTVQNYADPEVIRLIRAREKNDIASQYTMADALFSASFFNACLRHAEDVGMANIAPLVNTRGPLFVHPKGIVKRTHFHTMAIYANELEARVGKLKLEASPLFQGNQSIPVADAIATVDESGKRWAICLVNRHPDQVIQCTVKMKDRLLEGDYAAVVLAGDSPEAFNSIEHPDRVAPMKKTLTVIRGVVELPPHSLTVVKVPMRP
jgi:alpha-L-arabinofuranosidase